MVETNMRVTPWEGDRWVRVPTIDDPPCTMDYVIQGGVKLRGISTLCQQHIQNNQKKTLKGQPMGWETNIVSDPTVCRDFARLLKRSANFRLCWVRYRRQDAR